ncbi:longitudinals lacking protein-like [Onthophagus taurus]|uniref:longitudinals lacking protein-like n=1 Tax=Onthophagus taurus TaxID=166361 RepID=UPI000C20CB4E|nr:protein bric-a-brac 2-like [Onthophagus taurus]
MDEQYMLRWHYQETTICRSFAHLLDSDLLTDCSISAKNKTFRAHKIVLAACSTYFLGLFQGLGSGDSPIVVLHDANPEDVDAILSYIYKGQCLVKKDQVSRIISLAKILKIQGLCNVKISDVMENDCDKADVKCDKENGEENENQNQDPPKELTKKILKDLPEVCKCFICGKYLSNQYNLRVHMETHKDTYYSCVSCPHVSKSRDALRKHVSYRHPEEYTTRKKKKTC